MSTKSRKFSDGSKQVGVRLEPWMTDLIAELAKADDRSMSFIIRYIIVTHPRVQAIRPSDPSEAEMVTKIFDRVFAELAAQRAIKGASA